jgi:RimJ/RimL family protein N-acetyltransferase
MQNPFLLGPTTYLRPVEPGDAPTLVPWLNDPEVTRYLLIYRPMSVAQEEDYLRKAQQSDTDLLLGIVAREGDRLIGMCGLHQMDLRNRHTSFGICVGDRAYWGKGHGTEATRLIVGFAFETLNLNRVWLHVFEYNERAVRTYEKVGFRHEGRFRQHHYREGRYWDCLIMSVLRDEWLRPAPTGEPGRASTGGSG